MSLVKVGFIGAGNLASRRIYPCLKYAPISLEAVCDLDRAKAEENARLFGGKRVYTDYTLMIEELDLDAVIVCVAPEIHSQLIDRNYGTRPACVYREATCRNGL